MPKVFLFLSILVMSFSFFIKPTSVQALPGCPQIQSVKLPTDKIYTGQPISVEVTFESDYANPNWDYHILVGKAGTAFAENDPRTSRSSNTKLPSGNDPTVSFTAGAVDEASKFYIELRHNENPVTSAKVCDIGTINVYSQEFASVTNCKLSMPDNVKYGSSYQVSVAAPEVKDIKYSLILYSSADGKRIPLNRVVAVNTPEFGNLNTGAVLASINFDAPSATLDLANNIDGTAKVAGRKLEIGEYTATVVASKTNDRFFCAIKNFSVTNKDTTEPTEGKVLTPPGASGSSGSSDFTVTNICETEEGKGKCTQGAGEPCKNADGTIKPGISTALGCVPTEPKELIAGILTFSTGVAGGIALLLMAFGAIRMITSAGNPEALKGGQEQFSAAIIGLLFIIFSVLLLRIIGVDILGLGTYLGVP